MATKQPLGKVELRFDNEGNLIGTGFIGCSFDALPEFKKFKATDDPEALCEQAKWAFSGLFTLVNKIELADREEYAISSVLENVKRNEQGIITDALISFSLDKI